MTLTSRAVKRYLCLKHLQEIIYTGIIIISSFSFETNKIKNDITSNLVFDTRGTEEPRTDDAECFRVTARADGYDVSCRHIYCRCYDESCT